MSSRPIHPAKKQMLFSVGAWRLLSGLVWEQFELRRRNAGPQQTDARTSPWPPPVMGLSSTQEAQLRELFEEHGMEKRYLDIIAEKWQGGFSRARVSRHLKSLGLKRGVLTATQVSLPDPS